MSQVERDVVLLIADISGYTRYMLKHAHALGHAQAVITALMQAVIAQAKLPLRIAKLEGDAIFLYAAAGSEADWARDRAALRARLPLLYLGFTRRAAELALSNTCPCEACEGIELA